MITNAALLIIDMQVGLIEPAYQSRETLDHIGALIKRE